jgi:hypothetical protein
MIEWCLLIILKAIYDKVFIFHIVIDWLQLVDDPLIDFRVTRSKVNVAGKLNFIMVSAYYLEKYLIVLIFHILIGYN